MFELLTTLLVTFLYIVAGFAIFCGIVPLLFYIFQRDRQRVEQILDLYVQVFAAIMSAIVGILRIFRRKDDVPAVRPTETKRLMKQ